MDSLHHKHNADGQLVVGTGHQSGAVPLDDALAGRFRFSVTWLERVIDDEKIAAAPRQRSPTPRPRTSRSPTPDAPSHFGKCPLGVAAIGRSLFLPDVELARCSRNARAAGVFGIFGRRLAVFFENHPDIGLISGRPVRI
jgi:hypothetical protein